MSQQKSHGEQWGLRQLQWEIKPCMHFLSQTREMKKTYMINGWKRSFYFILSLYTPSWKLIPTLLFAHSALVEWETELKG